MATSSTKTSLEAIPLLNGRQNYTSWSKQIESHLKASNAWEIITGRWERPSQPLYFQAPIRPVDLIASHRLRREQEEQAQADDPDATPLPHYTPLSLKDAKEELEYIKAHIEQWDRWEKTERTAINDIISRLSDTCKEELGSLDDLTSIWDKLKVLYVESTCETWVKELNMDIFMAYILTVNLGDDLTATTYETYRQSQWPNVDSIRTSISEEYQSKLNAGKTKPTAAARPDNEDEAEPHHVSEAEGTTPVISTLEA